MAFKDIINQQKAVDIIKGQLKSGKTPHAYLFIGPEGTGRKKTAFELAKALNCRALSPDNEPCGECASCQKISKNIHPDVQVIDFEWQSRLEGKDLDKQKAIKIDTIRALQKEVSLKPSEARWKIFIIDPAEKITLDAANCLLKTLEEPPSWTVLVLVAKHKDNLPATIVSRTQIVSFGPLSEKEIVKYLTDKLSVDYDKAVSCARQSEGSLSMAIKRTVSEQEDIKALWDRLLKGDIGAAEAMSISSENSKNAAEFLAELLFAAKSGFRQNPLKHKQKIDSILRSIKLLDSNCNAQMVLDVLLLELI